MKMTYRKAAFIGLWAGVIFASCSSDEDMITGKTLPQGKYPVAMTVSVGSPSPVPLWTAHGRTVKK